MILSLQRKRTLLSSIGCAAMATGALALASSSQDGNNKTNISATDVAEVEVYDVPVVTSNPYRRVYAGDSTGPYWYTPTTADDGVVATITIAVDENNNIMKVLVNNVKVEDELVVQAEGNVELVGRDGDLLVQVELIADTLTLVQLVTPEVSMPAVRVGITMEDVSQAVASQVRVTADEAVMIAEVVEGGPAEKAGLQRYDIITFVDGTPGATQARVREVVQTKAPGDELTFIVYRAGELQEVVVAVEAVEEPGDYTVTGYLTDPAVNTALEGTVTYQTDLYRPTLVQQWLKPVVTTDRRAVEFTVKTPQLNLTPQLLLEPVDIPQLLLEPVDTSYGQWVEGRVLDTTVGRWVQGNLELAQPSDRSVILEVAPRWVEGQIVLDTAVLRPTTLELIRDDVDPICQLRQQVAQLKAQIIKLEDLLGEMGDD